MNVGIHGLGKGFAVRFSTVEKRQTGLPIVYVLGWALVGLVLLVLVFVSTVKVYAKFTKRSLLYMGENKEYERMIDESLGLPFSQIIPKTTEAIFRLNVKMDYAPPIESIIASHPQHFLGYVILAWCKHLTGKEEEAKQLLKKAKQICADYPDTNASLMGLFPKDAEFGTWPHSILQLANNVWAISGPFKPNPEMNNILDIQMSVVKLKNGSVVVINPGSFTEKIVEYINSLGKVDYLVTTTFAHNRAIVAASKIWPEAKLVGVDEHTKHGERNLKWHGFIDANNPIFGDELVPIRLNGHLFKETALYHTESRSMLGLTDLAIPTEHPDDWGLRFYAFMLGMWRGPFTTPIGVQSYNYMFIRDIEQFKSSVEKLLFFDIDTVVLGHGGVFRGNEAKKALSDAYGWLLRPNNENAHFASYERVLLPLAYLQTFVPPSLLLYAIFLKLFKPTPKSQPT